MPGPRLRQKTKNRMHDKRSLKEIEKLFHISLPEIKRFIRDFHREMRKGLRGKKSSLKMIHTYVRKPTGAEKGRFLALDLGGTHFRVMSLELKGNRKTGTPKVKMFVLRKMHISGKGKALFDFIASCIKVFMKEYALDPAARHNVGFTFSFPIKKKGIASGVLLHWTKDFTASGVKGKDVVELLNASLKRKGLSGTKITALANDTVSTLTARSYEDPACDVGVILGTGTNACYPEKNRIIINIEWGNFNKQRSTRYDRKLDKCSGNPGRQLLEKMVSGMYMGEVARRLAKDLLPEIDLPKDFKSEYTSVIESDTSKGLRKTGNLLKKIGVKGSTYADRKLLKKVCSIVSTRAARLAAAAIASVITKMDPRLRRRHTVAIDGAVYEKHPRFSRRVKDALSEIFGGKARRVKLVLTKGASAKGAAVIAAT